jgi:hypothetical protein
LCLFVSTIFYFNPLFPNFHLCSFFAHLQNFPFQQHLFLLPNCDLDSAFLEPRHIFHNPHIAKEWLIDVTDWLNDWLHFWKWRRASRQDRTVNCDRTTRGTCLLSIILITLDVGHPCSGNSGNV